MGQCAACKYCGTQEDESAQSSPCRGPKVDTFDYRIRQLEQQMEQVKLWDFKFLEPEPPGTPLTDTGANLVITQESWISESKLKSLQDHFNRLEELIQHMRDAEEDKDDVEKDQKDVQAEEVRIATAEKVGSLGDTLSELNSVKLQETTTFLGTLTQRIQALEEDRLLQGEQLMELEDRLEVGARERTDTLKGMGATLQHETNVLETLILQLRNQYEELEGKLSREGEFEQLKQQVEILKVHEEEIRAVQAKYATLEAHTKDAQVKFDIFKRMAEAVVEVNAGAASEINKLEAKKMKVVPKGGLQDKLQKIGCPRCRRIGVLSMKTRFEVHDGDFRCAMCWKTNPTESLVHCPHCNFDVCENDIQEMITRQQTLTDHSIE